MLIVMKLMEMAMVCMYKMLASPLKTFHFLSFYTHVISFPTRSHGLHLRHSYPEATPEFTEGSITEEIIYLGIPSLEMLVRQTWRTEESLSLARGREYDASCSCDANSLLIMIQKRVIIRTLKFRQNYNR